MALYIDQTAALWWFWMTRSKIFPLKVIAGPFLAVNKLFSNNANAALLPNAPAKC